MPTLVEVTSDRDGEIDEDSESSLLDWASNPGEVILDNLRALSISPLEQQSASQEVDLYDANRVESVLPITATGMRDANARAAFRLSESSQMHNSGNSIQISFNYNAPPSPARIPSENQTTSLPVTHIHTQLADGLVTAGPPAVDRSGSTSPLSSHDSSSLPMTPRSSSSARQQASLEVQFFFFSAENVKLTNRNDFQLSERDVEEYLGFPREREDGCYVEPVTSADAIPFPRGIHPSIKAYMSSELFSGFQASLIPLWIPRRRPFDITVSDVGLVGDVGFFDASGSFKSLFNIFWTEKENIQHGYDPPRSFEEYSNFKMRNRILERSYVTPTTKKPILHGAHGKFRREDDGSPDLLFRADAKVTDSSHGSVIAYNEALEAHLDETHPPAKKTAIQSYLNRNAARWYMYYNDNVERNHLKNGQLMLVHTSLSTDTWASAVFTGGLAWEVGAYYARIPQPDPKFPNLYSWDTHECVKAHSSHPVKNSVPNVSDHCIAIGVDAIHIGDPPGHKRRKIQRGLFSLSQSISTISMQSITNSIASKLTIRRRQ